MAHFVHVDTDIAKPTQNHIKAWEALQRTNVSSEASSPLTSQDRLMEIVHNAKSDHVLRVASNQHASAPVLLSIYVHRPTLQTAKRLASNKASPIELLNQLADQPTPNFGYVIGEVRRRALDTLARKGQPRIITQTGASEN